VLYQSTNHCTQVRLLSKSANTPSGYSCRYFSVRNNDSEYGSLLTDGRLNEGTTPSVCAMASSVAPFIALPLSQASANRVFRIRLDLKTLRGFSLPSDELPFGV
jgi:hypothetical protein